MSLDLSVAHVRRLQKISLSSRAALLAVFLAGLFGPKLIGPLARGASEARTHESMRLASPDKSRDAVLVEVESLGAWKRSWQVRIVEHKSPPYKGSTIFSARGVVNPKLAWRSARLLEVGYDRARIDYFTSVLIPRAHEIAGAVEIKLAPSSPGFSYLRVGPKGLIVLPE